jgi:ferredoxin
MTRIKVTFRDAKGNDIKTIEGNEGDDLLSLAHEHDVDLEGRLIFHITPYSHSLAAISELELITGACERSIACSTCHVILDPEIYDKLPEPEDEENDMLDLAFALEDTYVRFLISSFIPPSAGSIHLSKSALNWIGSCLSPDLPMSLTTCILDGADTSSRLGCQVFLTKEVDGMVAKLPSATRNMYVDGESTSHV